MSFRLRRKWFKTRCEIAGMKSINIEKLMGHSIGISDSYYRATENELLDDYLRAVPILAISNEHRLQKQMEDVMERSRENDVNIKSELHEKDQTLAAIAERDSMNTDALSALSEKITDLKREIEILKKDKACL